MLPTKARKSVTERPFRSIEAQLVRVVAGMGICMALAFTLLLCFLTRQNPFVVAALTAGSTALFCMLLIRMLRKEIFHPLQALARCIDKPFCGPPGKSSLLERETSSCRNEIDLLAEGILRLDKAMAQYAEDRKQFDRALAAERRSFEDELAERTHVLEVAHASADQASRRKSAFLADMSHEIRTPVNAIAGFATLAMRTDMTPKQQDYLEKINSAASMLQHIIDDLLDLSKIEAGHLNLDRIPFSLQDVLDTAATYVGGQAERKGIELLLCIAPDVPVQLLGDPLRLGQILINLCTNAVKFTEQGEVEVRASVKSSGEGQVRLLFSVRDTGIGLTPEQANILFQPFTQAETLKNRELGGTGLGLVICKRLVRMMQGEIWLESQAGLGTTVFFELDLGAVTVDSPAMTSAKPGLPDKITGKRVLVVDDNASARRILSAQLEELGMEPHAVDSGEAAISELIQASLQGTSYHAVLMDWCMPGLDGIVSAAAIQRNSGIADIPSIIMMTAQSHEKVASAMAEAGLPEKFLIKPVTRRMLARTLAGADASDASAPAETLNLPPAAAAPKRLPGARLLLVEDNPINQQLARELLESEGAEVTVADNGRRALDILDACGAEAFNAVLLDLQMPEMDGYETARQVRAMPVYARLPLIAMTAHAMLEERERCFAIGMQDHLSKPIDIELMVSTLRQWIGLDQSPAPPGTVKAESNQTMPAALPDVLPGIDMQDALRRCGGNARLLQDLLFMFHDNNLETISRIQHFCSEGNWADAQRLVHSIKGAASNLAMTELAQAAAGLEMALVKELRTHGVTRTTELERNA